MPNPWLPSGFEIDGFKVAKLVFEGKEWQLYNAVNDEYDILVLKDNLVEKLIKGNFLKLEMLHRIDAGSFKAYGLIDKNIFPMNDCKNPIDFIDAKAVCIALRRSREIDDKCSLNDSIYVEKYSLLLPTWTETTAISDDIILGKYLTGGVDISVNSFQRLAELCSWLDIGHLQKLISEAGLELAQEEIFAVRKIRGGERRETRNGRFELPGRPLLEEFFNDHIVDIVKNEESYKRMGIEFPSATILYGPPGCGKTYAAQKLIEYLGWSSYSIDSSTVGSPYIHQTSKLISETFETAQKNAPSVVIIDEMEAFVSSRGNSGYNQHHVEEVGEFLRIIPEAIKNKVLIIAMTNHIDMIDSAVLRTGRFDNVLEVSMPSKIEVASLVKYLLSKRPVSETLNTDILIESMVGRPLSDTDFIIREAARIAAKNNKLEIEQECLDTALNSSTRTKKGEKEHRIGF